jgi:hypothetical protein
LVGLTTAVGLPADAATVEVNPTSVEVARSRASGRW